MRSLAVWLTILVACSRPTGIELVVAKAPSNVKVVRVFLGISNVASAPLDPSTALTVPAPVATSTQGTAKTTTTTPNIFVRDPDNAGDWRAYTPGVSFEFQPDTDGDSIDAAIIVGYTGSAADDVPVAAVLEPALPFNKNMVEQYTVDLSSPDAALPFLWSTVADASTSLFDAECAGFSGSAGSAFIVKDADDEDCDGFHDGSTIECSPFNFDDQNGVASVANGTCFVQTTNDECRLGGLACIDGSGVDGSGHCSPTDTCLASAACGCPVADSTHALECLIGNANTSLNAGFVCQLGLGIDNDCEVLVPPAPTGGMPCRTDSAANYGLAADGAGAFSQTLQANGYTYKMDPDDACSATIHIDPMSSSGSGNGGGSANQQLLMKLELINGASVIIPITLAFNPLAGGTCASTLPTSACQAPPDNVGTGFTDPTFTQCMAGWGSSSSTTLQGISPTLPADMSVMYYIASEKTIGIAMPEANGTWTGMPDLTDFPLAAEADPLALHLSNDGMTMYIVDDTNTVTVFKLNGTAWSQTLFFGLGSGLGSGAVSFSPNMGATDAIYSDATAGLWEVMSANGPPYSQPALALGSGNTPYMTEDSLALWTSALAADGYVVMVRQRTSINDKFIDEVELTELHTSSMVPQSPWIEPVPLAAPNMQMMFYSAEGSGDATPTIYSVQRAPLLVP